MCYKCIEGKLTFQFTPLEASGDSVSKELLLRDGYNYRTNTIHAVALANGAKPFAEMSDQKSGGVVTIVDNYDSSVMSQGCTKGNYLPRPYQEVVGMDRGVWGMVVKQEGNEGLWKMELKFISTSRRDEYNMFPIVHFNNIYLRKDEEGVELFLPKYECDDYQVMLEEALAGSRGCLVPCVNSVARATVNPIALKRGTVYSRPLPKILEATM